MILLLKTELIKIYLTPLQANISQVYIGYTWLSEFVWTLTTVKKKLNICDFSKKNLNGFPPPFSPPAPNALISGNLLTAPIVPGANSVPIFDAYFISLRLK